MSGSSNAGSSSDGGRGGAGEHGGYGGHGGYGEHRGVGAENAGAGGIEDAAGSTGDAGAGGEHKSPCDPTLSPSAEACLVSNEFAVFVDPAGNDSGSGTKASPLRTITKALQLAGADKIVIACTATFDEQVKVSAGARIYGGFACRGSAAPWTYEAGKRAKVAPTARGFALSIATGAAVVDIADIEFDAKDGSDSGDSSIAAFVKESTGVAFHRVKLVAGKGVDGADGTRTDVVFPTQTDLNGNAAIGDAGGVPNSRMCSAGRSTRGGRGGDGGGPGADGNPGLPDLGGGKGGTVGSCGPTGTGKDGTDAPSQPPAAGASKVGAIIPTGWIGIPGLDGTPGFPGQGGGGGAGAATGGGGGGGGAGGCGGNPGTGGKAGGSSIALLLQNSTLTFDAALFSAANAGNGGKGVVGQEGQPQGGSGGDKISKGCAGGAGGKGGSGGAGGGAAGGISVGIAYQGTTPTPDAATTITVGMSGTKGLGGVPGTNDGIDGKAQSILEVP